MPVIMIVVTSPASYFGRFTINQRHNGMVGDPAAFYAVIVYDVA